MISDFQDDTNKCHSIYSTDISHDNKLFGPYTRNPIELTRNFVELYYSKHHCIKLYKVMHHILKSLHVTRFVLRMNCNFDVVKKVYINSF